MNATSFDTTTQIARIGAGSLWSDVYAALEQYNATAPGGRTATVGVGGFILGGGNNFVGHGSCLNSHKLEAVLEPQLTLDAAVEWQSRLDV